MSNLIHILPVSIVLVAAVALMLMSMFENRFNTKQYIIVSSIVLVLTLVLSFIPFGESYSIKPYESRITSYNVCYTKLLRTFKSIFLC